MLTVDLKKRIDNLIEEYGENQNALLPVLEEIQNDLGCVPQDYIKYISKRFGIPMLEVYSVLTFYGMLKVKEEGKFAIKICDSLICHINSSEKIIDVLKRELGINPGEKTPDGLFSLETVGCLGLCDSSPAMLINGKVFTNLTENKVKEIIKRIREKGGRDVI